jgi:prephenate dehydrogenase
LKQIEECTIGIIGLGLMGGAFAMALRNCGAAERGALLALDRDGETLKAALAGGIIDEGFESPESMLPRCDLVFLCLNPSALISRLDGWMTLFRPGCIVTDIAGTKGNVTAALEKNLRDDIDFIPGHPMAGAEKGGFANAKLCDFRGRNYILTPLARNRAENIAFLKDLIRRMGFGRISEVTAEEHDRKIAFTSQLCHVIAAALIDCEADSEITRFGGGSFEDLTRIAMLNAPMWTEIFIGNKNELLKRIEQFEGSLDALKSLIADGEAAALEKRLDAVRARRAGMPG